MIVDNAIAEKRRRRRRTRRTAVVWFSWKTGMRIAVVVVVAVAVATAVATTFLVKDRFTFHGGWPCRVAALTLAQRRAVTLSRIRRGMLLSQEAKRNVTAAEEACRVWETVLSRISSSSSSSPSIVTDDVLSLSKSLYASCLVRVGRDAEAAAIYDSCLTEFGAGGNSESATAEWRLAKARCLQRLLRYSAAAEEYSRVVVVLLLLPAAGADDPERPDDDDGEHTAAAASRLREARLGAATCILRSTGDVSLAREVLVDTAETAAAAAGAAATPAIDVLLLFVCLDYLETGNGAEAVDRLQEVLSSSDESASFLLYRWILASLKRKERGEKPGKREDSGSFSADEEPKNAATTDEKKRLFMELIRINASPLDDPGLLRLDDKILLHGLLTTDSPTTTGSYWPDGFVLPAESSGLKETPIHPDEGSELWIAKSRAGYGSHGNRILTLAEARKEIGGDGGVVADDKKPAPTLTGPERDPEPYLLQRMIDPLMLLDGRKFSLRIYVVSFSSDEAYISSRGLVKLASAPLFGDDDAGGNDDDDDNDATTTTTTAGVARDDDDAARHMTNSGRETSMRQEDLDFLWRALESDDERDRLWEDIRGVAEDVLGRCSAPSPAVNPIIPAADDSRSPTTGCCSAADDAASPERHLEWKRRREGLGIPKILGLDFVVDAVRRKPWLVEVNRFPGLEPRDERDRSIKHRVVGDAWKKASERLRAKGSGGDDDDDDEYDDPLFSGGALFESLSRDEDDDEGGRTTKSSLERLRLDAKG